MFWIKPILICLSTTIFIKALNDVIVLDSWNSNYQWENEWDYVTQTGYQTGNNEVQDYSPKQVQVIDNGTSVGLILQRTDEGRYLSGKIQMKKTISQMAPNGGAFEISFNIPKNRFEGDGGGEYSKSLASGLWPAIWIISRGAVWPTGGESDLLEMMHKRESPQSTSTGFSTLHFGPRRGVDAVYDGHWGLKVASFKLSDEDTQSLYFSWRRTGKNMKWLMEQRVNGVSVWSQATDQVDRFLNFEDGKKFERASAHEFSSRGDGNPAKIFQNAFDNLPMYVNINLAFGGTPFSYVNRTLVSSIFIITRFRLWKSQ